MIKNIMVTRIQHLIQFGAELYFLLLLKLVKEKIELKRRFLYNFN